MGESSEDSLEERLAGVVANGLASALAALSSPKMVFDFDVFLKGKEKSPKHRDGLSLALIGSSAFPPLLPEVFCWV